MLSDRLASKLMAPLIQHSNAVLTVKGQSIRVGTNPDNTPKLSTPIIQLEAIAHKVKDNSQFLPGASQKVVTHRGRLTNPLVFPDSVKNLQVIDAVIDGVQGKLTLYLSTQNPYTNNKLGDEFEGEFKAN